MAANKDPICSGVTTPCRLDSTLLFVRVRAVAGPMFNPVMPPVMGRWSPGSSPDLQKKFGRREEAAVAERTLFCRRLLKWTEKIHRTGRLEKEPNTEPCRKESSSRRRKNTLPSTP